jgi:hypothetical protein
MGGRSSDLDPVGLEKGPNVALDEALVKITADATGKAAGVNKESPQGIYDAGP